ncbi:hypothetical protein PLESTB_000213800 [Pleodorina starrii]|uniref:Protein cereblon n=1 Tax=Pleodorina starrii TaxID=330485 RepID=A0A9W6BD62_9CHLO|nr:hypothetical protein PLESTM_001539500 [Pleodorina starrii]GLC49386.1 hypothetical protein PLESTB_000213800 [Pleodorina starrii]GLC73352.1 hypothetical protein PLESTF_001366200 [Pleodorina starrii]
MLKWALQVGVTWSNSILVKRLKNVLSQLALRFSRWRRQAMAEQPAALEAEEDSSSEDGDGVPRGNMERVPSFDLDATDAGAGAAAAGGTQPRRFDPNTAAQHRYLGDVDELGGGSQLLEEGRTYTLPLFPLDGVVLLPGESLPLFLHSPRDILKLERALRLPAGEPTARLIAVTHESWRSHMSLVGCSAEIRRLRRHQQPQQRQQPQQGQQGQGQDAAGAAAAAGGGGGGGGAGGGPGVVALVARGRQRLQLEGSGLVDTFRVRCRVLPEGLAEAPPRQMSAGATYWAPWAARPFDAPALAARVQQLCSGVLPQIATKMGTSPGHRGPLALQRYSYWLGSNLPLSVERRQQLLECRDAAERLRLMLGWLTRLGTLACRFCGSAVTQCSSALLMSSEGAGGAFVNAHGFVHDIATFRSAQGLSYQGQPETAHSWFPGYAWTIANCAHCTDHLGWRFTACSEDLRPAVFWGLRRAAIICPDLQRHQRTAAAARAATADPAAAAAAAGELRARIREAVAAAGRQLRGAAADRVVSEVVAVLLGERPEALGDAGGSTSGAGSEEEVEEEEEEETGEDDDEYGEEYGEDSDEAEEGLEADDNETSSADSEGEG